jgi:hypothetical protein
VKKIFEGWTFTIVFWALLLASIALNGRYPVLDALWYAGGMLFVLVVSILSLASAIRNPDKKDGFLWLRGIKKVSK